MSRPRSLLAALGAVAALALAGRLWGITRQGIWFDEAVLACFARLSTAEWLGLLRDDVPGFFWIILIKAPLFALLMRGWTALAGDGELALRLPSLLLGLLAVWLLYRLTVRLLDQPRALWASLLLALNPFHVYWSQQHTEYSLLLCFGLGSMLLWLRERQDSASPWPRAAVNLLALGVHPMGVLAPGVQFLLGLGRPRPWARAATWLELLPLGVICAYGLALATRPSEVTLTLGWVDPVGWAGLEQLLRQFLHGGLVHGHLALERPALIQTVTLAVCLALAAMGATDMANGRRRELAVLGVWLAAPLLVVGAFSLVSRSLWVPRYMIIALPPLLVLVAAGLHGIALRLSPGRSPPRLAVALLPAGLLGACLWLHNQPPEGSLRELAPALRQQLRPGDGVVITPDRLVLPFGYYWDGKLTRWLDRVVRVQRRGIPADATFVCTEYHAAQRRMEQEEGFQRWLGGRSRVWVIAVDDWPGDAQTASLLRHLRGRRRELSRRMFNYSGAELILFGGQGGVRGR